MEGDRNRAPELRPVSAGHILAPRAMASTVLYTSCVLGAIALYLLLRPGPRPVKAVGVLIGLGALAWVL